MKTNLKISTSVLGVLGALTAQAQEQTTDANQAALKALGASRTAVSQSGLLGGNCYGMPCPDDPCHENMIQKNLQALARLNIVAAENLSPFACTAYCTEDTPIGQQIDRCEKAQALAELVKLAAPLAVRVKH